MQVQNNERSTVIGSICDHNNKSCSTVLQTGMLIHKLNYDCAYTDILYLFAHISQGSKFHSWQHVKFKYKKLLNHTNLFFKFKISHQHLSHSAFTSNGKLAYFCVFISLQPFRMQAESLNYSSFQNCLIQRKQKCHKYKNGINFNNLPV